MRELLFLRVKRHDCAICDASQWLVSGVWQAANPLTGELTVSEEVLDRHKEEATAWACVQRWSERYNAPIEGRKVG